MRSREPNSRRWFSNQRLISAEAILLVGLLDNLLETHVRGLSCSAAVKTFFFMLSTVGAFGILLSVAVLLAKRSLAHGHKLFQALPISTPDLVLHGLALAGIYWLYANYY